MFRVFIALAFLSNAFADATVKSQSANEGKSKEVPAASQAKAKEESTDKKNERKAANEGPKAAQGPALGGDPCKNNWKNLSKRDPKDPCGEAELYDEAAKWQGASVAAYGAAAVVCGVSCYCTGYTLGICALLQVAKEACRVGGLAGTGIDATGMIMTQKATKEIKGRSDEAQIAGLVASGAATAVGSLFLNSTVNATLTSAVANVGAKNTYTASQQASSQAAQTGTTEAGKAGVNTGTKENDWSGCAMAAIYLLTAGHRAYETQNTAKVAQKAREKKLDVLSGGAQRLKGTVGGGGEAPTEAKAPDSLSGLSAQTTTESPDGKQDTSSLKPQALAATARNQEPKLIDEFEKLTNKSLEDFTEDLLTSKSPEEAMDKIAAVTSASANENQQKIVAAVRESADAFNEEQRMLASQNGSPQEFAATGSTSKSKRSSDSGMPDLSALFGGMMGGAQKEEAPQGAKGPQFGGRTPARAEDQGFHSTEKSLFAVVSTRYNLVRGKFLTGDLLVPKETQTALPSSSVRNPYLRNSQ